ncbi:capsid maturation protease [Chelonid alphaherpesvirus 5]|uniref:Capsid scaffolding protein n=4 Tax=Chelonid alphaherpesvirus 5 TaxID=702736 RepID=Q5ZR71_9ALPH|nr:capsid maturation protease [Hawaiian green turtle herpesvirus]YP_010795538.1 capsid maturation protease [Chelonid alphaherpesvirus 5]AAU93324.1 capsid maturation protease [Hawaiian green turtle herpesvirus]AHA93352.1 capsid maturation protease [Chelonid alphaherpesvirus 5]
MQTEEDAPLYVAGFLGLYDRGGEERGFRLDREAVRRGLPLTQIVPLCIDHKDRCTVGRVLSVLDAEKGAFCVAKVTSKNLFRIMLETVDPRVFELKPGLSEREKLLLLISNFVPSFSLSSVKVDRPEEADERFFVHVSLCMLGRRQGTIAIYDETASKAVSLFEALSAEEKQRAIAEAVAADEEGRHWDEQFNDPEAAELCACLFSQALNTNFVDDRWEELRKQKRTADISGATYLQASVTEPIIKKDCGKNPSQKMETVGPAPPLRPTSVPAAPSAATNDYVSVPMEHYHQLLLAQSRPASSSASTSTPYVHSSYGSPCVYPAQFPVSRAPEHSAPGFGLGPGYFMQPGPTYGVSGPTFPQTGLEAKMEALLKKIESVSNAAARPPPPSSSVPGRLYYERVMTNRGPCFRKIYAGSERPRFAHCFAEEGERGQETEEEVPELIFPGEAPPPTKKPREEERAAEYLGLLAKTVTSLQTQVEQLKQTSAPPPVHAEPPSPPPAAAQPAVPCDPPTVDASAAPSVGKNPRGRQLKQKFITAMMGSNAITKS